MTITTITSREYRQLTGKKKNLAELLYMPGVEDIEFEVPKLSGDLMRPADFSVDFLISEERAKRAPNITPLTPDT